MLERMQARRERSLLALALGGPGTGEHVADLDELIAALEEVVGAS